MAKDELSEEDKALFRSHVRNMQSDKEISQQNWTKQDYFLSDYISESVSAETILSYAIPGFCAKRFRDLKQGKIPWEARLDLHGLHKDRAREALCQFIQYHSQTQKKSVLIIHGKGGRQGEEPMIKNLVNRWLVQLPEVIAFHSASAKDGGSGAVFVLLKKNKDLARLR